MIKIITFNNTMCYFFDLVMKENWEAGVRGGEGEEA